MAKKKKQNRHSLEIQNRAGQVELSNDDIILGLKEKLIEECRQIAKGAKVSIYELIEMTKELEALEAPEDEEQI